MVVAISVIGGRDIWKRFLWGKPYSLINAAHILLAKMQAFVHTQLKRRLRNRFIVCLGKEKINFAEDLGNLFLNPKFIWLQILVPLYIVLIHEDIVPSYGIPKVTLPITLCPPKEDINGHSRY